MTSLRQIANAALALCLLALPDTVSAQTRSPIPDAVKAGLDVLVAGNLDSAVALWTASWTGPENAGKPAELSQGFRRIAEVGGRALGYEWVRSHVVSDAFHYVYLVIRYEKLPVFARFAVYRPSTTWVVASVNFHTDPAQVFPSRLLEPQ